MSPAPSVLLVGSGATRLAPKLQGWNVSAASLLALDELQGPVEKVPSLVLLSAGLEEASRWVRAIRSHPKLKKLPLVASVEHYDEGYEKLDLDAVAVGDAQLERQLFAGLKARAAIEEEEKYQRRIEAYLKLKDALGRETGELEPFVLGVRAIAESVTTRVCAVQVSEAGRVVKVDANRSVRPVELGSEPNLTQALDTGLPLERDGERVFPVLADNDRAFGAFVISAPIDARERSFVESVADNLQLHARAAHATAALEKERAELERAYLDRYRELSQANKRLEALDEWKDKMLAMVGHDARAPLQVLLGHGRMLLEDQLPPEVRPGVDSMVRMGRKLLEMMESALDFARTTRGAVSFEPRATDVCEVCKDVAHDLQILAEEKRVRLKVEVPKQPVEVNGDAPKLKQVLQNLVVNALQHGQGARNVTLRCASLSSPGAPRVKVSVEDDGEGFAAGEMSDLFDRYERDGIGKGLSICRELVRAHGGEIWAEQRQGGGSVLAFSLPQLTRARPRPTDRDPVLLLADDDPNIRKSFSRILGRHWRVETAVDGAEAIDKARALRPDLMLIDLFMPKKDGLDAIRELRRDVETAKMPIILMSARAEATTRTQGQELQGVELVPKLTAPEELITKVRALLTQARTGESGAEPAVGLLDQAGVTARLEEEQARAQRYGRPLSLLVLKPSSSLGDDAPEIAAKVREQLRSPDLIAHTGFGTLVLVLPETALEPAQALANRLCAELDEAGTPYTSQVRQLGGEMGAAEVLELLL